MAQNAPAPAALGLAWRLVGALGMPALAVALLLWRDVALDHAQLDAVRGDVAALNVALRAHLDAERARLDSDAMKRTDDAVAQARLEAAIAAVRGQIDALLSRLPRRG